MKIRKSNIVVGLMCLAVILYGFSVPFPLSFGMVEFGILLCLIMAHSKDMLHVCLFSRPKVSFIFFFLFFVPTIVGVAHGNEAGDMFRDLIPVLYFCIPLLFFSRSRDYHAQMTVIKWLPRCLMFVGILYAARETHNMSGGGLRIVTYSTLNYMVQSPAVLFTAIYPLLLSLGYVERLRFIKGAAMLMLAVAPILSIYFITLRAPMALIVFSALIFLLRYCKGGIFKSLLITGVSFAILAGGLSYTTGLFDMFIHKHQVHGDNSKLLELTTAASLVFKENPLLGYGWGALWYSPAAGTVVRFAHSLLTYLIIKMGIVGVVFFIGFAIYITANAFRLFFRIKDATHGALLLSCLSAILVNILLESAYKTLDFGMVLLLFCVLANLYQTNKRSNPLNELHLSKQGHS